MSRKPSAKHIVRAVAELPAAAVEPRALPEPPPAAEGRDLARELIQVLKADLEKYRRASERDKERYGDPAAPPGDWQIKEVLECPPQDVDFGRLERLARRDPERMQTRWEEVKAAAEADLASGWLAARAAEPMGGRAWERACFLATRKALRTALRPRDEVEAMLVDELAQYETLRRRWLNLFSDLSNHPAMHAFLGRSIDSSDRARPITASQAVNEAARMVDKMQRLYHQTLRTLQGLRRSKTTLFVGHVGQFNLAATGPQSNVRSDSPAG